MSSVFHKFLTKESLARRLSEHLSEVRGDSTTTYGAGTDGVLQIHVSEQQALFTRLHNASIANVPEKVKESWMCSHVEKELSDDSLFNWATTINDKYRTALIDTFTDFSPICSQRVSSEDTTRFYHNLRDTFLIYHG